MSEAPAGGAAPAPEVRSLAQSLRRTVEVVRSGVQERPPLFGVIPRAERRLSPTERTARAAALLDDVASLLALLEAALAAGRAAVRDLGRQAPDAVESRAASWRELARKGDCLADAARATKDDSLAERAARLRSNLARATERLAACASEALRDVAACQRALESAAETLQALTEDLERTRARRALQARVDGVVAPIVSASSATTDDAPWLEDACRLALSVADLAGGRPGEEDDIRAALAGLGRTLDRIAALRFGERATDESPGAQRPLGLGGAAPGEALAGIEASLRAGIEDLLRGALERARSEGSVAAWRAYLREFPKGRGVSEAGAALARLETESLAEARAAGQPAAWRSYLSQHPEGKGAAEAREALARLEQVALARARASSDPAVARRDWEAVLRDFPASASREEAEEAVALARARTERSPRAWRAYREAWPEGVARQEAEDFLAPLAWVPDWAEAWGEDQLANGGRYVEIRPEGVVQRLRLIQPGTFAMGSPETEPARHGDETLHEATLTRPFWLAATECTQALWDALMDANPSRFKGEDRPVDSVSAQDARSFLGRLSSLVGGGFRARLPSEAEWEYACRAGSEGPHAASRLEDLGWFDENSGGETHAVGELRPNAWGLYDMHGNVREWCADFRREYGAQPVADPIGEVAAHAACRGGRFDDRRDQCRSARREGGPIDQVGEHLAGFRIAADADVAYEDPISGLAEIPADATFLGDLPTVRFQTCDGRVWINDFDGQPSVSVGARRCTQFIGLCVPGSGLASITWNVPPGARRFTAVGAGRTLPQFLERSWAFQVLIDGRLAFDSPPLRERRGGIPIDIALPPGARELTLRIDTLGSAENDQPVLAWPCFHGRSDMLAFLPEGALFAGDLQPKSARVGWEEFFVNGARPGGPIPIRAVLGRVPDRYVYTYPPAEIVYEIPEGATRFTGIGARADWEGVAHGTWLYRVLIDGRLVFESKPFHEYFPNGPVIDVLIPPGSRQLAIVTDPMGDTSDDWSFLAWPCFHLAGASLAPGEVALRASDGRFLSLVGDEIRATAREVGPAEALRWIYGEDRKLGLRVRDDRILSAIEGGGDRIGLEPWRFGPDEALTLGHAGQGRYVLLTRNGRALSLEGSGRLAARGREPSGEAVFTLVEGTSARGPSARVDVSDLLGSAALHLLFDERFVRAERNATLVLDARHGGVAARGRPGLAFVAGRRGRALHLDGAPRPSLVIEPPPALDLAAATFVLRLRYGRIAPQGYSSTWLCQDRAEARVFQLSTLDRRLCWHRMGREGDALSRGDVLPGVDYHVAVVVEGSEHRLYLDGELQGRTTGAPKPDDSVPVEVGHGVAGPAEGLVEEILVLPRALSDAEVRALFRA